MDLFLLLKYSWFTVYSKVIRLYICIYMWIYVCILVQILFHCGLWDIEYSSLCNRVGPCCLYKNYSFYVKNWKQHVNNWKQFLKKKKKNSMTKNQQLITPSREYATKTRIGIQHGKTGQELTVAALEPSLEKTF